VVAGHKLQYMSGFGNQHSSEALPGALPVGQNSPQKVRTEAAATANGEHPAATLFPVGLQAVHCNHAARGAVCRTPSVSSQHCETVCGPRPALRSPTSHAHVARCSPFPWPVQCPYGLYAEQLSGTAFTVPRAKNERRCVRTGV
jgi:homogentisate 1,2-dioxygenase